ncbi:hypothetical protein BCR34DRAFT_102002 [Clohesyomyces aquaticus]|uniref:Fungal-specific transcription factor domain-domain-containing protein n=1 Tax=Clohesyomyces aquaticus TaxID=1231657 RepID=A0A1Y1YSH2_9PLEO|nr:hypothetical protein BCR34DRAFT_102002 [Clohesyomyces aquaticus]
MMKVLFLFRKYCRESKLTTFLHLAQTLRDTAEWPTLQCQEILHMKAGTSSKGPRLHHSWSRVSRSPSSCRRHSRSYTLREQPLDPEKTTQKDIATLTEELDAWAVTALPKDPGLGALKIKPSVKREQLLLAFQYYSTRLLISRPYLCRLERQIRGQSNTSAAFNNKTAAACVQAAHTITGLLPDEPDLSFVYQRGPWWCIVHNIMQAISVFLLEMSFGEAHMTHHGEELPKSTKKLVRWLQAMCITNAVAERAHEVAIDIIKTEAPQVRIDISDIIVESARGPDRSHMLLPSQRSSYLSFLSHPPAPGALSMGFPELLNDAAAQGAQLSSQHFLPPDPQYLMLDPDMQRPLRYGNPFMTNFDQPDLLEGPDVFDPGSYNG